MSAGTDGPDERLARALELHRQGRLAEAEPLYRALLDASPGRADVWNLLGVVAAQRGDHVAALVSIGRALAIVPHDPASLSNRGNALRALGRDAEALASYDAALVGAPSAPELHNNRGTALSALGHSAEALACFERALALRPAYLEASYNRAAALRRCGRRDDALAAYDATLALAPDHLAALGDRGSLRTELGRHADALLDLDQVLARRPTDVAALVGRAAALSKLERSAEALASADAALALAPDHPLALVNRGNALADLERFAEALAAYGRVLSAAPDHAQALTNRGATLVEMRRHAEALADYGRARASDPDCVAALVGTASALSELRRFDEALVACDRALVLEPRRPDALFARANVLRNLQRYADATAAYAALLAHDPDYPYALGHKVHAALHACDWRGLDADRARLIAGVRSGTLRDVPFTFLAVTSDGADQLTCATAYARREHPPAAQAWRGARHQHQRIRLGYLSADLYDHATAHLMAELFERHDRTRFEVLAFSFGPDHDGPMHQRLRRAFDGFHEVRELSDAGLAGQLAAREVDVAIDLKGYTHGARPGVLARRGAPLQVAYLGYPGTLGAPYVDYLIVDAELVPPGHEDRYAERIVRLPGSYQANDRQRPVADRTPSRAEVGLPERGFVFCSFNNGYKITPEVFGVWMRLLGAVAGSVLWLYEANADAAANLRREATARGIDPQRLVFASKRPLDQHLARQRLADLFLDTLPINAHTTASDALWVGLPIVTCRGDAFASRVAASLLRAVGLPELIVDDLPAYQALALRLARDPAALAALKARLAMARDAAPLFDAARTCRLLESAYLTMHERQQQGLAPEGFDVAPLP